MAKSYTKQCQNCGKDFQSSPNDYTVNCPECRSKRYVKITRSDVEARRKDQEYLSARFKCKDCDEVFDRSGARKHRSETGHRF